MSFELMMRSLSRIKGDDPTKVIVPPRIAQKPIGISKRLMGSSVRTEIRLTTGKNNAAAPTFCMKLEIKPTVPEMIGMIRTQRAYEVNSKVISAADEMLCKATQMR